MRTEQEKPMRVLEINSGSGNFGGVSSFLYNVNTHIDRSKVQFDFLSPNQTTYGIHKDEIENLGGRIYELGITGNILSRKIKLYFKLREFLRKNEYRIVHVNSGNFFFNLVVVSAIKKEGVPVRIVHSHNAGDTNASKVKKMAFHVLKPCLEKNATDFMACSRKAAKYMFSPSKASEAEVVPNGIEVERFRFDPICREEMRNMLGVQDNFVVGHVGRFLKQKNHAFLIDIFYEVLKIEPTAVLLLFGTGELQEEIKEKVEHLGIQNQVRFMGVRADIEKMYQAMDVFLMPSFHEGLPVTGIEVQASGLPMILSDAITEEVKIVDSVEFVSLSCSAAEWAKKVCSYKNVERKDESEKVASAGYSIQRVADEMGKKYLRL